MQVYRATGFNGGEDPYGLLAVANSIAHLVDELIPGDPPFGDRRIQLIRVDGERTTPRVLWANEDIDSPTYRIHLKTQTPKWQQMAFQLSHELAHVKMGPARSNLLIEVVSHAVSLESLKRLQTTWKAQPPFPWDGWADYADGTAQYGRDAVEAEVGQLPVAIRTDFSSLSLGTQVQRLNDSKGYIESLGLCHPESRAWQIVAAGILNQHILNTGGRWAGLLSLAIHTTPSAMDDRQYRDDLRIRIDSLPTWLPEFVK